MDPQNHSKALPNWQKKILTQIDGRVCSLFVAADPDALLSEESMQSALTAKGFSLYCYDDSIALRYFLEHKIKPLNSQCVISVDTDAVDINALPFDILKQASTLSCSLGDCFPELTYSVLQRLQLDELNILDEALADYSPGQLNHSASCDFVLRHVFKVAPEVIQTSSDLLKVLLGLHYRSVELPEDLKNRLIKLLEKRSTFASWPLASLVSSKPDFFAFLQAHWPNYLDNVLREITQGKPSIPKPYTSINIPFGHDDVRIYIDNLFLEGYLTPVELTDADKLAEHWSIVGILIDDEKAFQKRFDGLVSRCNETLPTMDDRHQQWQQFAYRWAELSALYHNNPKSSEQTKDYLALQTAIDERFSEWLRAKFASLINHPPLPPVMLHHVPRAMARDIEASSNAKVALILIDGLALDQWLTIKQGLSHQWDEESSVFAWVPTVTSVSRQALFSGKAPYQFAKTIGTTRQEPKAWEQFWLDHGLNKTQVYYEKGLGTDNIDDLLDRLSDRRHRALGLVINTVDDLMHGMLLGAQGMHNQVSLWAETGYLDRLVGHLVSHGYSIYLTSDHGNAESKGVGKINEGAIAEERGERTRVYATKALRESVNISPESAVNWPTTGLPNDYFATVMKGRDAFVAKNETIVGHGGITIEEVIVPFIKIKSKT